VKSQRNKKIKSMTNEWICQYNI